MYKKIFISLMIIFLSFSFLFCNEKYLIKKFELIPLELKLRRNVQIGKFLACTGRKSSILGTEEGNFEIWIYPLKILHDFNLSFLIGENQLIQGKNLAQFITVYPHYMEITYTHPSFTVKEIMFCPLNKKAVIVLLSIETIKPLSIIVSFVPDLKPMWPAGLGGQYSYWNKEKKYFVISEGTRRNVALVGCPIGKKYTSPPAHALPEIPLQIKIDLTQEISKKYFIPIVISASAGGKKEAEKIYFEALSSVKKFFRANFEYYGKVLNQFVIIKTPDTSFNQAFQWAKLAVDKAFVCNPHLGCGLIAGYGLSGHSERPGFAWFFGGDTFYNSFALNSYGDFMKTRQALTLIRENQRKDGKIMHELSQGAGYINWFEDYPYGFYHAETTPYYIISIYDYIKASGDLNFLEESWSSIKKAYQYMLSTDTDNDGLMENSIAGMAALELGEFLGKTKTDIYLAGLSTQAWKLLSKMAELMGDKSLAQKAYRRYQIAFRSLNEKFWLEKEKKYCFALTTDGDRLKEDTGWISVPMFFKLFNPKRAEHALQLLSSSKLSTDWGIRMLSKESQYYDPLNYNYGSVWPFVTGYATLAEFKYNHIISGFSHLKSLARNTFIDALGFCSELFSGEFFIPIEEAVPFQIFSSSPIITSTIRGLFGLEGDALKKEIRFSPQLPGNWSKVEIENYRIGENWFNFQIEKKIDSLILTAHSSNKNKKTFYMFFTPFVGFGTEIKDVKVNNKVTSFNKIETDGKIYCQMSKIPFFPGKEIKIEIYYQKRTDIVIPEQKVEIGDRTKGLKLIKTKMKDNNLYLTLEGLGGKTYPLELITRREINSIRGAKIIRKNTTEKILNISFPREIEKYVKKEIKITLGEEK